MIPSIGARSWPQSIKQMVRQNGTNRSRHQLESSPVHPSRISLHSSLPWYRSGLCITIPGICFFLALLPLITQFYRVFPDLCICIELNKPGKHRSTNGISTQAQATPTPEWKVWGGCPITSTSSLVSTGWCDRTFSFCSWWLLEAIWRSTYGRWTSHSCTWKPRLSTMVQSWRLVSMRREGEEVFLTIV